MIVNKRVRNAVLGCSLKNDRMISVHFQGKPFSITVIQVYAPTINAEEVERFYEDLQDLLELTPKKGPLHYRGLECKSRKSRATWSNRQIWARSTKWSRSKANRVLPRQCTGHSKHALAWRQEMTLHRKITIHLVNTKIRLHILLTDEDGETLYSQQKQDRELTVAQIMNSLLPNSDLNWRK